VYNADEAMTQLCKIKLLAELQYAVFNYLEELAKPDHDGLFQLHIDWGGAWEFW
jgi:hypothetical protein